MILGQRVLGLAQLGVVCNTVVIVNDATSYVQAISRWTPKRRFPVLIDDGTSEARENIARFVRSFKPAHVVRWSAKAEKPAGFESADPTTMFTTVARVWGVQGDKPDQGQLLDLWKNLRFAPPGIVVTQTGDRAWPAALALAAGRGEPIVFIPVNQAVDGSMSIGDADRLEQDIETAAEVTNLPWRGIGDAIEAVTLCNNGPARMENGKGEYLALTDRIGRVSKGVEDGQRWAWCGQIFGNPEQSCYRAMCSLFLTAHQAWIFDGYPNKKPWSDYDGSEASKFFKDKCVPVELYDSPHQGARDWRLRAARSLDAGVILINSMGNCDFFNLEPGQCRPGDVPFLDIPAALHIVHSWSAEFPAQRNSVGGRWIERGVFAYAGSVHEPYLDAFVPTPKLAARLISGAPFGVAVRIDGGRLWRVAVLGDPLFTFGPEAKRTEEAPIEGATEVGEGLREMLTGGKYAEAMNTLTLQGAQPAGAQLAQSLIATKPEAMTPEVAAASVLPLIRAGDNRGVLAACGKLDGARAQDPVLRDALWLATYPLMDQPTDEVLRTLRANLRTDQVGRDAADLGDGLGQQERAGPGRGDAQGCSGGAD